MPDRLTEEELADRAGTNREGIRRLVELGILRPDDGAFARGDVMRARVVGHLDSIGIEPEALAKALASGHLTLGYLESSGRRHPRSELTFAEVGEEIGIPFATLERIYVAFGLPRPAPDERVREEDLAVVRMLPVLFGAGVGELDVLRLARVWGDGSRRIAEYLPHYFHVTVEEQFRRRGLGDNEAFEAALREVGVRVGRSGENLLGWLFRRHSEVFMTGHQFEHVESALEDAGVRRRPPRSPEAAVFADLSGYTQLTERLGDEAAAEMSLSLAQLVNEIASRHRGTVVKLLGDGVYLHFRDPGDAVRASLEIVESTPARGLPPAHVGAEAGPMLYDEGDYFGRTVNIAARIAAHASGGHVYVGGALAEIVVEESFRVVEAGEVELKGIAGPVRIFEAVRG
ncbi:MAG TPA: adenylate/guanylate cyclase domain-containing protein [Candidatus Limnocylindrales bacterium]|nr:adenylate/guanylate cyclase domain-containing protein [Candidatus Limnocylindrales bacterium]